MLLLNLATTSNQIHKKLNIFNCKIWLGYKKKPSNKKKTKPNQSNSVAFRFGFWTMPQMEFLLKKLMKTKPNQMVYKPTFFVLYLFVLWLWCTYICCLERKKKKKKKNYYVMSMFFILKSTKIKNTKLQFIKNWTKVEF